MIKIFARKTHLKNKKRTEKLTERGASQNQSNKWAPMLFLFFFEIWLIFFPSNSDVFVVVASYTICSPISNNPKCCGLLSSGKYLSDCINMCISFVLMKNEHAFIHLLHSTLFWYSISIFFKTSPRWSNL